MPKRVSVELDLPDEVLEALEGRNVAKKAKEALVLELIREHYLSQGKAAEVLGISRSELFPLMTLYQVPVIDLTPEELDSELKKPFPQR